MIARGSSHSTRSWCRICLRLPTRSATPCRCIRVRRSLTAPDQLDRLRSSLIDWMSTGLLVRTTMRSLRIARGSLAAESRSVSPSTTSSPRWASFGARTANASSRRIRLPKRCASAISVDKLLDVELAVMLGGYHLDSEDRSSPASASDVSNRSKRCRPCAPDLLMRCATRSIPRSSSSSSRSARLRRGTNDPKLVEPIELAEHELDRLTTLLDEFLAFAHPHALDLRAHDVVAIAQDVVEHDRALAEQARRRAHAHVEPAGHRRASTRRSSARSSTASCATRSKR